MRVVIADDELLLREGLERLLTEAGFEVTGKVGNPDELLRKVSSPAPTSRSSTSRCHQLTPTRDWRPHSRSAPIIRRQRCWCYRITSTPATRRN